MNERYNDFLNSADWKSFAEQLKIKRGGKCEICGSDESLEAHHLRYSNNLMNEDDLIVLCDSCHGCIERMITRFNRQMNCSCVVEEGTFLRLMKQSILDFYQNSIYKPFSKATLTFNPVSYSKFQDQLHKQLRVRFPEMEIMIDYRHIRSVKYDYLPRVTQQESGVTQWRNDVIQTKLEEGASARSIKELFRLSDQAYQKAKGR